VIYREHPHHHHTLLSLLSIVQNKKKVSFFFLEGAGPFLPISLYKSVGTKMSAKLCETIMGRTGEEHKSVLGFAWRSLTVVRERGG
jgi:hypothetical protein